VAGVRLEFATGDRRRLGISTFVVWLLGLALLSSGCRRDCKHPLVAGVCDGPMVLLLMARIFITPASPRQRAGNSTVIARANWQFDGVVAHDAGGFGKRKAGKVMSLTPSSW